MGAFSRKPTIARTEWETLIEVQMHTSGASKVRHANPPVWPEMLSWRQPLRLGDLFIDGGANAGLYTLWAADSASDVVAVEPSQQACQWLRWNIASNVFAITVVKAALTDFEGTVGSASSDGAVVHIEGRVPAVAKTLDVELGQRRAAGVKPDVKGLERLVLQGASAALADRRTGCTHLEWYQRSQAAMRIASLLLISSQGLGTGFIGHRGWRSASDQYFRFVPTIFAPSLSNFDVSPS